VRGEAILRIEGVDPPHRPVANDLRDDRSRRDGRAALVAVDNGRVLRRELAETEAVDEAGLSRRAEIGERLAKAPQVRAVQSVAVDDG
jgi:hypothetical protein